MSSLGKDLASIRHYKKKTLEDLHRETRIPIETFKRIESGAIFEDPKENRVYVRSFVRTYARALKIEDATITEALNRFQKDNYKGELLEPYPDIDSKITARPLTDEPEKPRQPDRTEPSSGQSSASGGDRSGAEKRNQDRGQAGGKSSGQDAQSSGETGDSSNEGDESESDSPNEPKTDSADSRKRTTGGGSGSSESGKAGSGEASSEAPKQPKGPDRNTPTGRRKPISGRPDTTGTEQEGRSLHNPESSPTADDTPHGEQKSERKLEQQIDWVKMGNQIHQQNRGFPVRTIGAILALLILAGGIYIIFWTDLIPQEFDFGQRTETTTETSAETAEPPTGGEEQEDLTLSLAERSGGGSSGAVEATGTGLDDTLYLTVYAADDRLDPVRVWSDLKPRIDPYWIEQGIAYNFEFQDTIRIQGQYDNMLLFLNGRRIDGGLENHFNQQQNSIELTRVFFSADPEWAGSIPLELPTGVAAPDTIQPRPTFNN